MNSKDKLPQSIFDAVSKYGAIEYALGSDLSVDRTFGKSFLILTSTHIYVADEFSIRKEFALAALVDICVGELVGGGRLIAETKESAHYLIYYSNSFVPHFADFARILSNRIKGLPAFEPDEQQAAYCPKCNTPLAERGASCPKCIPKFKVLARLIALTKPYKGKVALLMIATALGVVFQIAPPFITKLIVDEVISGGHKELLVSYVGVMILTGVLYLLMRLVNVNLTAWISARIIADLRSRLHTTVQYLKLDFFNKREPGEIVGRIMHDTGELQQFLVEGIPFLLINTISFFSIGAILFYINWSLALFVFLPVPVLVLGGRWFWARLIPLFHREGSAVGHMNSLLTESMQGLRVVKAFAREKRRIGQFASINDKLFATRVRAVSIFGSFNEIMFWVMQIGVALIWYFAVRKICDDKTLTLGDLLAFVGYIWMFYGPLQWFSAIVNWMSHAFTGAERIFEIIDSRPEHYENPSAIDMPSVKGAIEFRNVRFSYERGKEVLHDVSFSIAAGEVIGLVGKSGAGKSTIINLLSRFFEPDSGEVLIDGIPIKNLKLTQIRRNLGIVMQEPFLFNATLAENIAYGSESVSFKEIVEAAKAAYAHEFIVKKDDGYDTMVGESGTKLSGGEKQRISIARAILHNPPILILDEATSSVDADTEKHIQEAINNLIRGRTTIAIAHRLSTLRNANRLIVLDDGKVAEIGSHDELMKSNGIYSKLADAYMQTSALRSVVWG